MTEETTKATDTTKKKYIINQHEVKVAYYFVEADTEEEAYTLHANRQSKCVGEDYVSLYEQEPLGISEMKPPTQEELDSAMKEITERDEKIEA